MIMDAENWSRLAADGLRADTENFRGDPEIQPGFSSAEWASS